MYLVYIQLNRWTDTLVFIFFVKVKTACFLLVPQFFHVAITAVHFSQQSKSK